MDVYTYHAVDSKGNTIGLYISKVRNQKTAKHLFKKALQSFHISEPCVMTVNKNPAYPMEVEELIKEKDALRYPTKASEISQ